MNGPVETRTPRVPAEANAEARNQTASVRPTALACNDQTDAQDKVLNTIVAAAAMRGWSVYELVAGGYILCDTCSSRYVPGGLPELRRAAAALGLVG